MRENWNIQSSEWWYVLTCNNPKCNRIVFAELDSTGKVVKMYPIGSHDLEPTLPISDEIRKEYREAGTDLDSGCFLSSMTMSRRILQRCLKDHGCDQRNLNEQIDAGKTSGVIPKRYYKIADEIRKYGNIGAHPDDDAMQLATKENAACLFGFAKMIIEEFYVLPAEAEKLTQQRVTV